MGEHAIVIGCSIAGMSQAAVLCRHFSHVTIVEADEIDDREPTVRSGTPQSRQIHGLLNRGLVNLEKFLPGFRNDLISSGVRILNGGTDVFWHMNGTWWNHAPSDISLMGVSRLHFEFHLRKRLLKEKNITLRTVCVVTNYLSVDGRHFRGAEIQSKTGHKEALKAELVVDCSGRHSKTFRNLQQWGYSEALTDEVNVDVCYTTQVMRFQKDPGFGLLYIAAAPPQGKRTGILLKSEGDKFLLGLGGYLSDAPPKQPAEIQTFLESLPTPAMARIFPQLIPDGEPVSYRFKSNLRRYFSKLNLAPEGLAFSGDIVCSFDPIYGQGMTTATLAAEVMDRCLERRRKKSKNFSGLCREFQKSLDVVLDQSWMQALSNDLRYPEVQGRRTPVIRFMISYSRWVFTVMHLKSVHRRVLPVIHMMANPAQFFHPVLLGAAALARMGLLRPSSKIPGKLSELSE